MSSIGPDAHLNLASLDRLGGQAALDALHGRQQQGPQSAEALRDVPRADAGTATVDVDAGERLLRADAWEGLPEGSRLLSGDPAFESALGALELSAAADLAVDAIFAGIDAPA